MESGNCTGASEADIKLLQWVLGEEEPARLKDMELYGWLGEDELGSGVIGIKRGLVPAGDIPLVATTFWKMAPLCDQLEMQAQTYGKKIYLCRFAFGSVKLQTDGGDPL